MEKILDLIMGVTDSDRVILYRITENRMFATHHKLFQLRPMCIVSNLLAEEIISIESLYKRSYPYYIFADAIRILFQEKSFTFIPGVNNHISKSSEKGLESICTEAGCKSINYFLINEKAILSLHNCKRPSLINYSYILDNIGRLKELL